MRADGIKGRRVFARNMAMFHVKHFLFFCGLRQDFFRATAN